VIGRLLNALDRLPGLWQRGIVIVFPLLLFGVLVAVFALAPLGTRRPRGRSATTDRLLPPAATSVPAHTATVPPSARSSSPQRTTSGLDVDPDEPLPRASPLLGMLAAARSFASAYLLYEIGRLPRWVRRTIVASCTPAFARYLLARPAELAGLYAAHPRDVEVDRVVSASFAGGVGIEVSYVAVKDSADNGAFLVKLARAGGRWTSTIRTCRAFTRAPTTPGRRARCSFWPARGRPRR
jgi:hypothetical protein